jgi:alcohol dehydrogenase class IV
MTDTGRGPRPTDHSVWSDGPLGTPFAVLRAPSEVLFGVGMAAAAGRVAARYGARVLVCTDPIIAETPGFATVRDSLEGDVAVFADAAVDVPRSAIEAAVALGREHEPDVIVAVGGGSVIDLAKVTALLLAHGGALEDYYPVQSVPGPVVPLIALPTTAGTGSEATPVSVITDPKTEMKIGVASPHLIPRHAICDPELTVGAPATVTAHAGIDALSHAVEAYMAAREEPSPDLVLGRPQVGKNLLSDTLALTAAEYLARNLARAVEDGSDLDARTGMLYGSLLAGIAFGNSGVSAAHALQFAVGAATHTSHGLGTGLLLPYCMEFNRPTREPELAELQRIFGAEPVAFIHELGHRIGLPASLAEIGVAREDLRGMAEASVGIKRLIDNNPRPLDADGLELILEAAWHGEPSRLSGLTSLQR